MVMVARTVVSGFLKWNLLGVGIFLQQVPSLKANEVEMPKQSTDLEANLNQDIYQLLFFA